MLKTFQELTPEAEVVTLASLYPDANFDVAREQKRLVESGTIIFEFPIWWHSIPWLLSKYVADVLAFDFAYGGKYALEGKKFILSFTCGADEKSYSKDGAFHCTIDDLMTPMFATARYCKMAYSGKVLSYQMIGSDKHREEIVAKAIKQGEALANLAKS